MDRATDDLGAVRRRMIALLTARLGPASDGAPPKAQGKCLYWPSTPRARAALRAQARPHRDLARGRLLVHLLGDS